ncbi:hypothetical protein C0989_010818 [Termitomyces sp. Mn162]|nr:hypothetical protein C0989_010818 [Termitomyces sp. Mn162]
MFALKWNHPTVFIAEDIDNNNSSTAVIMSYDHSTGLAACIASCNLDKDITSPIDTSNTDTTPIYINIPFPTQFVANKPAKRKGVQVKKKYKPVAMKTKAITGHVSKDFRIEQHILGDPQATMPPLEPNLPPFILTKQFTSKQQAKLVKDYDTGFHTSDKINILVNMVTKQEKAFAWKDSEQGS